MEFRAHFPATAWLLRVLRPRRFWGFAALGVIAAAVSVMLAIRIDQALLRRDAEALLSDLRKLQVGISTQTEAQQLMQRFPRDRFLDGIGDKWIAVVLDDFGRSHGQYFSQHPRLMHLYLMLGGHPARVRAALQFTGGVLSSESIGVYIDTPEFSLVAGATFIPQSELDNNPHHAYVRDKLHPAYSVGPHPCDGCLRIDAVFLPGVDTRDVNRLAQFDLSCLNRWWHPCRSQSDIMPTAWQQYMDDQAHR
jgi:hypothetical protein